MADIDRVFFSIEGKAIELEELKEELANTNRVKVRGLPILGRLDLFS